MSSRHLVLGLDGADLDIVRALGPESLPTLHDLMHRGAYSHQRSVQPPATLPNWTTFLTGVDPGMHGVFDFTTRRGYDVRFTAGTVREAPTMVSRLDRLGFTCASIGFPATWPPDRLENGIFISGWDAPVAFEADRSFVWPPSLYDAIVQRFGPHRFDDVDEFEADRPGWHAQLPQALTDRIQRKTAMARWLIEGRSWDLFAVYFGESDTAAHHLWSLHDSSSPRRPAEVSPDEAEGLRRVYEALDAAVGELREVAGGDDVELTIVSDHGSGGSSDKVLYLNRALSDAGMLTFRPRRHTRDKLVSKAKDFALTGLPPKLRERLFRMRGAALPGMLESRARFGAIDMSRTAAFSDELNYFPAVWLNIRGREPRGTIAPEDVSRVRMELETVLRDIRDPWSGQRVVESVHPREAMFDGPYIERAPDLVLELALDAGYTYNLMPSGAAPVGAGSWRRLSADEHLGRKGRSMPGSHRSRGLFVAHGPRVEAVGQIDTHIADATATLAARMGVAVPPSFAGRVLWEALGEMGTAAHTLPEGAVEPRPSSPDERRVEARLRALGYID